MTPAGAEAELFIRSKRSSGESVLPFLSQAGRPPAHADGSLQPSSEVQTPGPWPQGLWPDRCGVSSGTCTPDPGQGAQHQGLGGHPSPHRLRTGCHGLSLSCHTDTLPRPRRVPLSSAAQRGHRARPSVTHASHQLNSVDVYWAPTMGKAQTRERWARRRGWASPQGAHSLAGERHTQARKIQAEGGEPSDRGTAGRAGSGGRVSDAGWHVGGTQVDRTGDAQARPREARRTSTAAGD